GTAAARPGRGLTPISRSSPDSRRQYGLNSRPIRLMFARRTSGSAGRSGGASPRSWENIPISALSVRQRLEREQFGPELAQPGALRAPTRTALLDELPEAPRVVGHA